MSTIPTGLLINAFIVLGALFAFLKGNKAERAGAFIVVANVVIGQAISSLFPDAGPLGRLCNDGAAALALLFVTITYAAPWMGGVMFFFAAQFALHSYYIVSQRPFDYTTALVNNINWSGITWCLILGTVLAWRRRMKLRAAAAQAASGPAATQST